MPFTHAIIQSVRTSGGPAHYNVVSLHKIGDTLYALDLGLSDRSGFGSFRNKAKAIKAAVNAAGGRRYLAPGFYVTDFLAPKVSAVITEYDAQQRALQSRIRR
jgi:hypothetical protein